jgi:hypothetical protein
MEFEERLKKENLTRLRYLTRQLNIKGRSKFKTKHELINYITAHYSQQEIEIALDIKIPFWKRLNFNHIYGIITTLALILGGWYFV